MATRSELIAAIVERYARGDRAERGRILDEFAAVTGFHRMHAARLFGSGQHGRHAGPHPARRVYDDAVREALVVIWEASDRVCGKRLKPLVPILVEAMERHGHLQLAPEVRTSLLAISAATIDRALRDVRGRASGRPRRHSPPSAAVRRSVPVRTFSDWHEPPPGFFEADLVVHSCPSASGSFIQTLVVTDMATGWTECAPLLVREQGLLTEVLTELRKLLPFALLGFRTGNDSVLMNEAVLDYCQGAGIACTRCRPYRKNDQAWVEQKNGALVRRIVGYRRFDGLDAAAAMDDVALERKLFTPPFAAGEPARPQPEWARIHAELRKPDVTCCCCGRSTGQPDGYGYSRFCDLHAAWRGRLSPTMRQTYPAGERLSVDYAGQTVEVIDGATGEARRAQIFVAVLGASNFTYAEARWTQSLPDWIGCHVGAFASFGGGARQIVCDNLKAGVTAASRYEPGINRTYQDMASHYGTAVLPARVRRPRDKAKVEVAVQVVQRWVLARLRQRPIACAGAAIGSPCSPECAPWLAVGAAAAGAWPTSTFEISTSPMALAHAAVERRPLSPK